ncbi:MAG: hypothetical protein F6K09_01295 [Merismopedia sp. SIO2A8]|nr:hypothetical protein [Merismopedia sp. SIO2A8]
MSQSPDNMPIGPASQQAKETFHGDRPVLPDPPPAGYAAPLSVLLTEWVAGNGPDEQALYDLAESILNDPKSMRQLSDRVFDLLKEDMRYQRDREGGR